MSKSKQQTFGEQSDEFRDYLKKSGRKIHGGVYAIGKRKTQRPFSSTKPIHLVMRSSVAIQKLSMANPLNKLKVDKLIHTYAQRSGVRVYDYSNNGNHLHMSIKAPNRSQFQKFLRTISGLIPRLILKAKKGSPKGKFWDALAFTRIAEWGKAFGKLRFYIYRNTLEQAGIVPYDRDNYRLIKIESTG